MVSVILDRYRLQRAIDLDQRANLVYADTIRYGVCIASNVKNQSIARAADTIINDAEKTMIFYLSNIDEHDLVANVVSTKSTEFDNLLKITNIGYRGQLPETLFIPKDMLMV